MDCVINGIKFSACKSDDNILFVDNYKEVFFDIFQIELEGDTILAEAVDKTDVGPIVLIKDITIGETVYHNATFLIVKEKADIRVHLNEQNLASGLHTQKPKLIFEVKATNPVDQTPAEKTTELVINEIAYDTSAINKIKILKEQALTNIQKEREELVVVKEQVEEANKVIETRLEEYKQQLLEQFYKITDDNKDAFSVLAEKKLEQIIIDLKTNNDANFVDVGTRIIESHVTEIKTLFEQEKSNLTEASAQKIASDFTALNNSIDTIIKASVDVHTHDSQKTSEDRYFQISEFVKNGIEQSNKKLDNIFEDYKSKLLEDFVNASTQSHNALQESSKQLVTDALVKVGDQSEANNLTLGLKVTEATKDLANVFESSKVEFKKNIEDELKLSSQNSLKQLVEAFKIEKKTIDEKIKELNTAAALVDTEVEKLKVTISEQLDSYKKQVTESIDAYIAKASKSNKTEIVQEANELRKNVDAYLAQITIDAIYTKFADQYGPKIESTLNEMLDNKTGEMLVEKFDFFKIKKVNQHLEQLSNEAYNKREPELIRKVKKLIMDFYYSYGTGGGSGNITIVESTSGGGGGGATTTPYAAINVSNLTSVSSVLDFFPLSAFKTAKYNIEVLSGNDVYTSEILVAGNTTVGKYTEFAVLYTPANPFISYSVVTTGTYLQLIVIASTTLTNMFFRGVRLDPIFQ